MDAAPNLVRLELVRLKAEVLDSMLGERNAVNVLSLYGIRNMEDLAFLRFFPNVTHLQLENCNYLKSLDGLEFCPHLQELELRDCRKLGNADAIIGHDKLSALFIVNSPKLSLDVLSEMQIKETFFYNCLGVKNA